MKSITIRKYGDSPTVKIEMADLYGAFVQAQREVDPKKSNQLKGAGHDHCRAGIHAYIYKVLDPILAQVNSVDHVSIDRRGKGYPVIDYRVAIRVCELLKLSYNQLVVWAEIDGLEELAACG